MLKQLGTRGFVAVTSLLLTVVCEGQVFYWRRPAFRPAPVLYYPRPVVSSCIPTPCECVPSPATHVYQAGPATPSPAAVAPAPAAPRTGTVRVPDPFVPNESIEIVTPQK